MKLGLGTVQFGMPYGITNSSGQTPLREAKKILQSALQNGVSVLDTAHLYKESETTIGQCSPLNKKFKIVTKTPNFAGISSKQYETMLFKAFEGSLRALNVDRVYGLLFHNPNIFSLDDTADLFEGIKRLRNEGLVKKIGASIYSPEQALLCSEHEWVDLIQGPMSLVDQRLLTSGALEILHKRGIEIHIRSAFLQGILFANPENLHSYFDPIKAHLRFVQNKLKNFNLGASEATFSFLNGLKEVSSIIVGVNNHDQFLELVRASEAQATRDWSPLAITDERFLNPANWRL